MNEVVTQNVDPKEAAKARDFMFDLMLWLEDPETIDWSSIEPEDVEQSYLWLKALAGEDKE